MLQALLSRLAGMVVEVVLTVAVLLFIEVINWFLGLDRELTEDDIGFTLKRELADGRTRVYQGVMRQRDGDVDIRRIRRIDADRLDPKLEKDHADNPLVLYT